MTRPQHVVVVAYGAEDSLDRALGALERAVDVTVVDNSSSEEVRAVADSLRRASTSMLERTSASAARREPRVAAVFSMVRRATSSCSIPMRS